ncbi:TerC family protein [Brevibacillus dissolubilis]|uniref:TerC family protein n=1 Tax=Brevibacillus dissolubilis TaxID=1844116 RepID=UPI0011173FA2|nr:TerC family protein [Brevibacillus dissolubilis]
MDLLSSDFWMGLLSIVVIDLVLAGDNAIVIGMTARNLSKDIQKRVILWGTIAAIIVRATLTVFVVWLLEIPFLMVAGGLLLIWIAYSLLTQEEKEENVEPSTNVWQAIRTIVIADVVMGLDNVLAIAGASHGSFILVILGLMVSVPIMVWGSTVILRFMERYPIIIYIGAAVLAWTASQMITEEPAFHDVLAEYPALKWGITVLLVAGVLFFGRMQNRKKSSSSA